MEALLYPDLLIISTALEDTLVHFRSGSKDCRTRLKPLISAIASSRGLASQELADKSRHGCFSVVRTEYLEGVLAAVKQTHNLVIQIQIVEKSLKRVNRRIQIMYEQSRSQSY